VRSPRCIRLFEYFSRSDCRRLAGPAFVFPIRPISPMASLGKPHGGNPGYYGVARSISLIALTMFGKGVQANHLILAVTSAVAACSNGAKTAASTKRNWHRRPFFPFWSGVRRLFLVGRLQTIHRTLGRDLRNSVAANRHAGRRSQRSFASSVNAGAVVISRPSHLSSARSSPRLVIRPASRG